MLLKFSLPFIFLSTLTTSLLADTSEDEIKKALANIQQIKVMDSSSPKIISEVIVKEKISSKIKRKKRVLVKKKHRKIKRKKVIKRKRIKQKINISQLQDVQTFGVIKTSQPFEIK